MRPRRPIGVLGGMGPEATVLFRKRLIDATPASDDADHVPLLVDMNPQVPSRIAFLLEGRGEDPAPVLAEMARRLHRAGAEALVMPCNTAHAFAGAVEAATPLSFLSMVTASCEEAGHASRVGILGSPALRRTGVFDAALAGRDRAALHPAAEGPLLAAIRDIKAGRPADAARDALRAAADDLRAQGADVILVACSEFSLHADALAEYGPVIDTLDSLVAATIAFGRGDG